MGMGIGHKLPSRLAEALVRVERDLLMLNGAGYFDPEEWMLLDGIIHKGEYLFTDGPEKPSGSSLTGTISPVLESVKDGQDSMEDVEDLLNLDDYDTASSSNLTAVEQLEPSKAHQMNGEEKPTIFNTDLNRNNTQQHESTNGASPMTRSSTVEGRESPRQTNTASTSQHMHPLLAKYAPQLSQPWKEGESVPHIRMIALRNVGPMITPTIKNLEMTKGDTIEIEEFISGHQFWAKNLRTGEEGRIHEQIFFELTWPNVEKIMDEHRAKIRRREAQSEARSRQTVVVRPVQQVTPAERRFERNEPEKAREWEKTDDEASASRQFRYPPKDNNQFFTQKRESPSAKTGLSSSKKQQGDKSVTCWFWNQGKCLNSEEKCKYAHRDTGRMAINPQDKWNGKKKLENLIGDMKLENIPRIEDEQPVRIKDEDVEW